MCIRFMVCDCQCGISSVGIWSGIIYDCLIFTVWYVIISILLFIPCWGIWLFNVHGYVTFILCDCQNGISSVGIWIGTIHDCLIFTVVYVISVVFIDPVLGIWLFGVHSYVTFTWWCVLVRVVLWCCCRGDQLTWGLPCKARCLCISRIPLFVCSIK